MKEAALIVVGWVLGLFSPIIVDRIKAISERRKFSTAIAAELIDLRYRLCLVSFHLRQRHGKLDRDFISWARPIVDSYRGSEPNESISEFVRTLENLDDNTLSALLATQLREEGVGTSLKTFTASYFESNVNRIADLPDEAQTHCHELRNHLHTMNQEILRMADLHLMTFDSSVTSENHKRLVTDIDNRTIFIAGMCKRVADKISNVVTAIGEVG